MSTLPTHRLGHIASEAGMEVPDAERKKLLGQSVEESRVKRLEKQQARYRDRGGIFVPSETNPLLDVLLARGVNGESPTKQRARLATLRRSQSGSPIKNKQMVVNPIDGQEHEKTELANGNKSGGRTRKSTAKVATTKQSAPKARHPNASKAKQKRGTKPEIAECMAGPSKPAGKTVQKRANVGRRTNTGVSAVDDDDVPKKKAPIARKAKASAKKPPPSKEIDKTESAVTHDTRKRKGRVKSNDATAVTVTVPVAGRAKSHSDAAAEQDTLPTDTTDVKPADGVRKAAVSRPRKRPVTVADSDEEGEDLAGAAHLPLARKKPRMPTPSDSEQDGDNVPLATRKIITKQTGAKKLDGIPPVKRIPSVPSTSRKGLLSSEPQGEARTGTGQKARRSKGDVKQRGTRTDQDPVQEPAGPAVAHDPQAPSPDEHDQEALESETTRTRNKRAGKRKVEQDNILAKDTRVAKRKKALEPAEETDKGVAGSQMKRLKSLSRDRKENQTKPQTGNGVRKPMPRLSLFPIPAMAADSEDELDLLR